LKGIDNSTQVDKRSTDVEFSKGNCLNRC